MRGTEESITPQKTARCNSPSCFHDPERLRWGCVGDAPPFLHKADVGRCTPTYSTPPKKKSQLQQVDSTYCGVRGQLGRSHGAGGLDAPPGPFPKAFLQEWKRNEVRGVTSPPGSIPGRGGKVGRPQV